MPERGRVLYLTHGYATHDRRFLVALLEGGWDPTFLDVARPSADEDRPVLPRGADHLWPVGHVPTADSAASEEQAAYALRGAIASLAPDVVMAGPVPTVGALAARVVEVPLVLVSWGSDLLVDVERDPATREAARSALARADGLLVDCEAVSRAAIALGMDPARIVRFPWGVDLVANAWAPPEPTEVLRLLSLRRLEPPYLVGTLVAALSALPGPVRGALRVTIASDGSCRERLQGQVRRADLLEVVSFVGTIPEPDVAGLLAAHDLHVSTAPSDGSSISLLQAMAVGRPSIVVDNASNREWVDHGVTGWLYPAEDHQALADRIQALTLDRGSIAQVAHQGRAVIEARADWHRNKRLLWSALASAAARGAS